MRIASGGWLLGAAVLVGIGLSGVPVHAADSVTGEVVDLSCYLHQPETGRGSTHRKCAETCAKKGLPMGVLVDDGSVVLLLEDHGNPSAYADAIGKASKTVTVEGDKVTQGGMTGIIVEAVK